MTRGGSHACADAGRPDAAYERLRERLEADHLGQWSCSTAARRWVLARLPRFRGQVNADAHRQVRVSLRPGDLPPAATPPAATGAETPPSAGREFRRGTAAAVCA